MSDFTIHRGDTLPPIEATLYNRNSSVNLTGADVYLVLEDNHTDEQYLKSEAEITDIENGGVKYEWSSGETDEVGFYSVSFQVVYAADSSSEESKHYPSDENLLLEIRE